MHCIEVKRKVNSGTAASEYTTCEFTKRIVWNDSDDDEISHTKIFQSLSLLNNILGIIFPVETSTKAVSLISSLISYIYYALYFFYAFNCRSVACLTVNSRHAW
jgi:hypothetical protein